VFTLFSVLIVFVVIALLMSRQTDEVYEISGIEKTRADNIHFLVKSVNDDVDRSLNIVYRRALLSLVNYEIGSGDYVNNSRDVIKTVSLNGTISGEEQPLMVDNTVEDWMGVISSLMEKRDLDTTITVRNTTILENDPFYLTIETNISSKISDYIIEAVYEKETLEESNVSILSLEDPFFTLSTIGYANNTFIKCYFLVGSSSSGGSAYGWSYVSEGPDYANVSNKNDMILVVSNLTGKSNYTGFSGIVFRDTETYSGVYVNGVNISSIENNTLIAINNDYVWLTGLNITSKKNSCYFAYDEGPSFLDRTEGRNVASSVGIASFIYTKNLPEGLKYGSNDYALDFEYFKNI